MFKYITVALLFSTALASNVQKPNIQLPSSAASNKAQVKNAFVSAYTAYHQYAFGHDDLQPVSKTFNDMRNGWGATIIDSMDTMLVMNLMDLYTEAVGFAGKIDFTKSKTDETVSVFETTIRYVGGMLAAYELNGRKDAILLAQSKKLADKLTHAWTGTHSIPYGQLNFTTNQPVVQTSNIAEAGTLSLEFTLLSQLTGNQTYAQLSQNAVKQIIKNAAPLPSLPAQGIDPSTSGPVGSYVTWGGGSDSYFEYLIKFPRLFPNSDPIYASTWLKAVESSIHTLMKTSTVGEHLYIADFDGQKIRHVGSHLACFLAGNWILGGRLLDDENIFNIALELNEACWNTYNSTATKIGPEVFAFVSQDGSYTGTDPILDPSGDPFYQEHGFYIYNGGSDYILRPEVLESNFYAYRATGNTKYLTRAAQTIQAYNSVLQQNGAYAGINDVNNPDGGGFIDDTQSFFFAEALKYLYLTFDDPNRYSLDKYVFNTECHLFPAGAAQIKTTTSTKSAVTPRAFKTTSGPVPRISPDPKMPKQQADIFNIFALPLAF